MSFSISHISSLRVQLQLQALLYCIDDITAIVPKTIILDTITTSYTTTDHSNMLYISTILIPLQSNQNTSR